MKTGLLYKNGWSSRKVGWITVSSGLTGIFVIATLITSLVVRGSDQPAATLLAMIHNIGLMLQFPLMIPLMVMVYHHSKQPQRHSGLKMHLVGLLGIFLVVIFVLLGLFKIVAEVLYMFPQGIFGIYLIAINRYMKGIISKGLRWFGTIIGIGLIITAIFIPGYAIFVDTIILQIPAASDEAVSKVPANTANLILHQFLYIGTLTGVLPFPIWAILAGRKLIQEKITDYRLSPISANISNSFRDTV